MLRKLALLLIPLALLAAACASDDKDNSSIDTTPQPTATEAAGSTSAPPSSQAEPTAIVIATPDLGSGPIDFGGPGSVLSSVNPFDLLDNFDGASSFSDDVDPALKNELLSAADLPSGFLSMGEFTFAAPSEYGQMQMAANIFASGDITSTGELGTIVMSASIVIPPGALDEFGADTLDEIRNLSADDLANALGGAGTYGALFTDVRVLDGSGLGDGGVGIHMMDLGALAGAFGAPADGAPAEVAMDMFMFVKGDHLHMTFVMYPGGSSADVDARHLAEVLDGRTNSTPL